MLRFSFTTILRSPFYSKQKPNSNKLRVAKQDCIVLLLLLKTKEKHINDEEQRNYMLKIFFFLCRTFSCCLQGIHLKYSSTFDHFG